MSKEHFKPFKFFPSISIFIELPRIKIKFIEDKQGIRTILVGFQKLNIFCNSLLTRKFNGTLKLGCINGTNQSTSEVLYIIKFTQNVQLRT